MSRAPSAVGPPARRQRTLLGFLKMSSLTRHSLEQIEVAAGTLAPRQTRNHQVWGPLALYSASPEALLKAKIGKFEYLTNFARARVRWSWANPGGRRHASTFHRQQEQTKKRQAPRPTPTSDLDE